MTIKLILLDLGGVLVELGDSLFPEQWLQQDFRLSEWFNSDIARDFERGFISSEQFVSSLKTQLSIPASEDEILVGPVTP